MASIFAQMSYDGLFFGRLHYLDKSNRLRNKEMEMIWQASSNLGESSDIFTGALFNTYSPPSGFCWDVLCSDEPFVDNKQSRDYNVNRLVSGGKNNHIHGTISFQKCYLFYSWTCSYRTFITSMSTSGRTMLSWPWAATSLSRMPIIIIRTWTNWLSEIIFR